MVEESPSVRERVHMAEEKEEENEEEKEKSKKTNVVMAWIQTHNLSLLSQVLCPLNHSALQALSGHHVR